MDLVALIASGVVQFDGGFGSLAAERNLSADCPERLNLTRPDGVRGIHRAYVEAGAQVIETNTLGANWARLAQHGLERDAERIVRAAVRLAREAGAEVVACSMGTSAEFLEPFGTLSLESAVRGFTAQAKAAKDAGADLLFTETLTDVAESRAMWMAAQAVGLPFGASFTFLENGRTLTGNPPEVCALIAESAGAALLGVNCVGDPALLLRCVEAMRAVSKLPVVAQPNAGIPERADGALQYPMTPDAMLTVMREAVRRGAAAVGGCCGTTPEHVRMMADHLRGLRPPAPGGDAVRRVCSARQWLPLDEALRGAVLVSPSDDPGDIPDAPAIMLDLRQCAPGEAASFVSDVGMLNKQPLLFMGNDREVLDAARRVYPGVPAEQPAI